jgi:hypothetical protein
MDDSHDSPPPDSASSSASPAGTPSPGFPPPHPEGWQGAPRHTPSANRKGCSLAARDPLEQEIAAAAEAMGLHVVCLDVRPSPRGVPADAREWWAVKWAEELRARGVDARVAAGNRFAVDVYGWVVDAQDLRDAAWKHRNLAAALAEVLA